MLADRNINRPSYVLAFLLGVIAIADSVNALIGMQERDLCSGIAGATCGSNAGWFVDLMTSGICAILVALLLLRPHLYIFAPITAWSFLAFLANFIMKSKGVDYTTLRMAIYFVVMIGAGVLTVIDGQKWAAEAWARRPMQPYPSQYSSQYPGQQGQFAPPPPPPAPMAPPPAPTVAAPAPAPVRAPRGAPKK
jgi:hypothetical protein